MFSEFTFPLINRHIFVLHLLFIYLFGRLQIFGVLHSIVYYTSEIHNLPFLFIWAKNTEFELSTPKNGRGIFLSNDLDQPIVERNVST